MARIKRRESSKKLNRRTSNRNNHRQSYKSSVAAIEHRRGTIDLISKGKRVIVPYMAYEDTLEASRLAEELIHGHDIAHIYSPSPKAKRYVLEFSKANRGKQAAQMMYNDVNRRLVKMNRRINSPTAESKKLYSELMSEEVYAE